MNLQEVVQTLIESGLSEADIAKQIGVSQPTVHRIKHGVDPAYTTGKRLEELLQDQDQDQQRGSSQDRASSQNLNHCRHQTHAGTGNHQANPLKAQ